MFTGLIDDLGTVSELQRDGEGAQLRVRTALAGEIGAGDSVAVNGVCLTASEAVAGQFAAHAMAETLARSTLGSLRAGEPVNIELAMRPSDRLGGHIVQGHVDATGTVTGVREQGFSRVLTIVPAAALSRYLVHKGSVTVDGVSLTISSLDEHGFSVSLIPETLRRTNLGGLRQGAVVNIEVDILAKHIARLLEAQLEGGALKR